MSTKLTRCSVPKLSAVLAFVLLSTCALAQEARPRVLVLPFALNASPDQLTANAFIAKAAQDNTVVVLSQGSRFTPVSYSGDLKSPDPASAARLARAAKTPYALYGSAQIVDANIRLTAQIIEASSGETLLTASSTGSLSNLLQIEDDLAQKLNTAAPAAAAAVAAQPAPAPAAPQQPAPTPQPVQKSVAVQALEIEQLKRDILRLAAAQAINPQYNYPQPTYGTTGSLPPDLSLVAQTNYGNYFNPYAPYIYSNLLTSGYYAPAYTYPYAGGFYLNGSIYGNNWNGIIRIGNPCYYPRYFGGGGYYYGGYNNYCNFGNYRALGPRLIASQGPTYGPFTPGPQMSPGIVNYSATTITRTNPNPYFRR